MKSSILAVGTELTQGQIVNSNASFISQKLKNLGFETVAHLVVPDERSLIYNALEILSKTSELIFVTGGLGPTSDDFTREVIAKWCGQDLIYDEPTYQYIHERLTSRGVPVRESQKQQCYFPKGSKILFNSQGTAHAFYCQKHLHKLFVLPGPPKEVLGLWNDVEFILSDWTAELDSILNRSWDCLGMGESEIAHLVESALVESKITKGYRVHYPYVEVKLMAPHSQLHLLEECTEILNKTLMPFCVAKNGQDILDRVAPFLSSFSSLQIQAQWAYVSILKRFAKYMDRYGGQQKISVLNFAEDICADLTIFCYEKENILYVEFTEKGVMELQTCVYPAFLQSQRDRRESYAAEMILLFLLKRFER